MQQNWTKQPWWFSRLLTWTLLLASISAAPACTLLPSTGAGDVVERSRDSVPEWAERAADSWQPVDTTPQAASVYVYRAEGLRNLPLGLKQSQAEAATASRKALAAFIRSDLAGRADKAGVRLPAAAPSGAVERAIQEALAAPAQQGGKVADIYFERIKGAREAEDDTYRVFVLVSLAAPRLADIQRQVGQRLARNGDAELRRLGAVLTGPQS